MALCSHVARCFFVPSNPCPHAGLNRSFSSGVIYCSPVTATLLKKDMGLPAERVIPLPVNTPHVIDGVTVILMDANHCPGACMMLFKVPTKNSKPQVRVLTIPKPAPTPKQAQHAKHVPVCALPVLLSQVNVHNIALQNMSHMLIAVPFCRSFCTQET